jgi:hypothetical protein
MTGATGVGFFAETIRIGMATEVSLWRALPAVICSDDDGWLGGHRQGLGEWYHGEMPAGWGTRAYPAGKGPGRKTHDVCRCDYVPAILLCRKLRGVFSWKPGQQLGRNQKSPARASGRDGVKFRKSQCAGQLPDKPMIARPTSGCHGGYSGTGLKEG